MDLAKSPEVLKRDMQLFFGGTLINIYFLSVRHGDSEGHRNSILKFSI